ncbi:MAG: hypothetical protein O7E51_17015, partial [Acidobacteria bacterium]|nr:hypothetical protein [Acidobacteriota bacterium]
EPPPDGDTYPKSPLKVLKIHGSASFQIAPYSNKPAARHVDLCFDERFFPRSAENKHGSWVGGETYLIAPSYVKIPTVEISHLMLDALQATNEAANLIIVGCSLRPEDAFLTLLHTNFLRKKSDKKIIIVGLEAKTIKGRLENYWGVNIGSCICAIPQDLENSVAELVKLISNSNSCCN